MANKTDAERYQENMQNEVDSATLYRTLAHIEKRNGLSEVYMRLAKAEENHAEFWHKKLVALGNPAPLPHPSHRSRILCWLAKKLGTGIILPIVNTFEDIDSAQYDSQSEAVAQGLPAVERSHARILRSMMGANPITVGGGMIARLEGRHPNFSGNALRAAVLGANDGLASNFSLVMGVAGATFDPKTILIAGLAGLLAGASSMALGEWLSVTCSRESFEKQIATEAAELEEVPEEEKEELTLIYRAKGLPEEQARMLADRLLSNKQTALDTLAREELGIDPQELGGSAWTAAIVSFLLFAVGALFPVLPFLFSTGWHAIIYSIISSGIGLFLLGAGTTLFTGRSVWFSGARQLLIAFTAAAITFSIGHLIGMAIH